MEDNAAQKTPQYESAQIVENSVYYGLAKIRRLMIEIELLRREHSGLVGIAQSLGDYREEVLPSESERLSDEDLHFKWSEQCSRYYSLASGVFEIIERKQKYFLGVVEAIGNDVQKMPRPLPEAITKQLAEITQYAGKLSAK